MSTPEASPALLLVDDNRGFVDLTAALIRRAYPRAQVGVAGTGEEALTQLGKQSWDVMLLDYRLPDIDGVEVLAEVRKQGWDVAVVMVTGEGDQELAADLFRMGAYDYLVKGRIGGMTLRRTIDQALTRRRLEAQIRDQSDELTQTSLQLAERARALDTAYAKLRDRKEQLLSLSESLEQTVLQRTGELRETTRFLNKVLASAENHFIIATCVEGTILTFNRGATVAFGRDHEELVGHAHFRVLFSEISEDDDALAELVAEIIEGGSIQRTLTGIAEAGRPFVAQVTLSQLRDGPWDEEETDRRDPDASMPTTHAKNGIVIVGSDVTHEVELEENNALYIEQIEVANADLRRKNEQILEATRLKSEFIANVSHELRTPLNAIIGYADLLNGGIYGDLADRQTTAVGGISTRANDLLRLINEILDLAKIESGRADLHPEEFSVPPLVHELVETGRILAGDKVLSIEAEPHEGGGTMFTDRNRVWQILLNLVNNAVKFTPSGFVTVESSAHDGWLTVSVADTGIGVPAPELDSIFDEFRQVDGTSTRPYEGSGLGLAISRKFATNLGGALTCRSVLGEGSTFELRIPMRLGNLV